MLIDTHTHLNLKDFNEDLENVLQRSFQNNIKNFIVPGLDEETNKKTINLSIDKPYIKAAVGIHPCYYLNQNPFDIEKYLNLPQVVAVGEIGLDLYHEKKSLLIQKRNLKIQIELAIKYQLPIILHARESFQEIYEILLSYRQKGNKVRGVFHCLVSNLQEAKKALDLNFYIGIGGIVTYEKAYEAHKIAKEIPLNKILLETDSPFLTPFPLNKNQRNEPSFLKIIAEKIAFLKNISFQEVSFQTTLNANELFFKKKKL
ncbi:DNAase [Candidatus Phytoplasma oryzae]|uniref:DNAase n=1 Tax=Candidatus Phytoplasma oryzae TaxID=203274 RepID=A0A328ILV6_9MOLU|nr:TatD family hydrolase [Candidatus Phytoplasma oryzae]RAM57953.1 DNAase [Candidatus Phytoplasma oryzae]